MAPAYASAVESPNAIGRIRPIDPIRPIGYGVRQSPRAAGVYTNEPICLVQTRMNEATMGLVENGTGRESFPSYNGARSVERRGLIPMFSVWLRQGCAGSRAKQPSASIACQAHPYDSVDIAVSGNSLWICALEVINGTFRCCASATNSQSYAEHYDDDRSFVTRPDST
jgi:hypothetical protein